MLSSDNGMHFIQKKSSDNGMHFIQKKLEAMLKKYEVHHRYGLGYSPQIRGQVEIYNSEIKAIMEKTTARSRKDW